MRSFIIYELAYVTVLVPNFEGSHKADALVKNEYKKGSEL